MSEDVSPEAAGQPSREMDRRKFLVRLTVALGSVGAIVVVAPSVAFLLGLRKTPQTWRTVGKLSDFAIGSTVSVTFEDPSPLPWAGVTSQSLAWLRRVEDQKFIAFSNICTHLGCPVRWLGSADLFMCPCHGGVFYANGQVASGPPPKPLNRYPVRIHNNDVQILTLPVTIS